jgi:hypothetical protein
MFDFATTDLCLAIVHHLLVFLLAGVLAFEVGAPGMRALLCIKAKSDPLRSETGSPTDMQLPKG